MTEEIQEQTVLTGATENVEAPEVVTEENDFVTDAEVLPTEDTVESDDEYNWVLDKYKNDEGEFDSSKAAKGYAELSKMLNDKDMLAPETAEGYELAVGEDSVIDAEALAETSELFKEMGIPKKHAQALTDLYETRINEVMGLVKEHAAPVASETASTLKEEWGNDFDANLASANKAINAFYDGDISKNLGLANNPQFAKFAAMVGAQLSEDSAPNNNTRQEVLTEEDVDKLIASDDYWDADSKSRKRADQFYKR